MFNRITLQRYIFPSATPNFQTHFWFLNTEDSEETEHYRLFLNTDSSDSTDFYCRSRSTYMADGFIRLIPKICVRKKYMSGDLP